MHLYIEQDYILRHYRLKVKVTITVQRKLFSYNKVKVIYIRISRNIVCGISILLVKEFYIRINLGKCLGVDPISAECAMNLWAVHWREGDNENGRQFYSIKILECNFTVLNYVNERLNS